MKFTLADGREIDLTDNDIRNITNHHCCKHEGVNNMERNDTHAPITGVLGTTLGGIGTAAAIAAGGMGLFGGGNGKGGNNCLAQENAELRAKIAQLTGEKYTDAAVLGLNRELSAVDERLHAMDDKLEKGIAQNKADIATNAIIADKNLTIAKLEAKNDTLALEARLNSKIDAVANTANTGIAANAGAIATLAATVAGITKTVIPQTAVCDTAVCGCGTANQ